MLFRDVKQGYPAYIFDRKNVDVSVGKVTSTSIPHFDSMARGKMVVDISIDVDGITNQYVLEDSAEVGYAGDKVISVGKDAVLREIERVKNQSEDALKMTEYHKEAVEKCKHLMMEYSPEYRERNEFNERMTTMENRFNALMERLERSER